MSFSIRVLGTKISFPPLVDNTYILVAMVLGVVNKFRLEAVIPEKALVGLSCDVIVFRR